MMAPSMVAIILSAVSSALVLPENSFAAIPWSISDMILFFQLLMALWAFLRRAGWVSSASVAVFRMGQPPSGKQLAKLSYTSTYTSSLSRLVWRLLISLR